MRKGCFVALNDQGGEGARPEADRFREITHLRGDLDPSRRWFMATTLDLIVWLEDEGRPKSFQLCYDKRGVEKVLAWHADRGFGHWKVDSGESSPQGPKRTPMLGSAVPVDLDRLEAEFLVAAVPLPLDIRRFVETKLFEAKSCPLPRIQLENTQDDEP